MARSKRTIAGFGQVATSNKEFNKDDNVNINDNDNVTKDIKDKNIVSDNINDNNDNDIIDNIMRKNAEKNTKKLVGIYFDSDVEKALNKLGRLGGKGAKSQIVNEIVKKELIKKGLLDR